MAETRQRNIQQEKTSSEEPKKQEQQEEGSEWLTAKIVLTTSYIVAIVTFMGTFYNSYIPKLPWPIVGNLLPVQSMLSDCECSVNMLAGMWCFHYLRRIVESQLYYKRKSNMGELQYLAKYYLIYGITNGWACNPYNGYQAPASYIFYSGVALFVIGEIGNTWAHYSLYKQAPAPGASNSWRDRHVIPRGILFEYTSHPHYFFEMIAWLGFALCAFTTAGFYMIYGSIALLMVRADAFHARYQAEFDGKDGHELYPPKRKALIPFIL